MKTLLIAMAAFLAFELIAFIVAASLLLVNHFLWMRRHKAEHRRRIQEIIRQQNADLGGKRA